MLDQAPNPRPSPPLPVLPLSEVSLGPLAMADDPCEAAFSGTDPTGPRKYYRARYYDPKAGRFISVDPLGLRAGPNVYAYVNNSPIVSEDPFGLIGIKEFSSSYQLVGQIAGPGGRICIYKLACKKPPTCPIEDRTIIQVGPPGGNCPAFRNCTDYAFECAGKVFCVGLHKCEGGSYPKPCS